MKTKVKYFLSILLASSLFWGGASGVLLAQEKLREEVFEINVKRSKSPGLVDIEIKIDNKLLANHSVPENTYLQILENFKRILITSQEPKKIKFLINNSDVESKPESEAPPKNSPPPYPRLPSNPTPEQIAGAIKAILPSVVRISVQSRKSGIGSGTVIKNDGEYLYILTAAHVTAKLGQRPVVDFFDKDARLIGTVPLEFVAAMDYPDLALIKVSLDDLKNNHIKPPAVIPIAKNNLQEGERLFTCGCLMGNPPTLLGQNFEDPLGRKHVRSISEAVRLFRYSAFLNRSQSSYFFILDQSNPNLPPIGPVDGRSGSSVMRIGRDGYLEIVGVVSAQTNLTSPSRYPFLKNRKQGEIFCAFLSKNNYFLKENLPSVLE